MNVSLHPLILDPIEFRVGEDILSLRPGQVIEVEPSPELQRHIDTNAVFVAGEHPTYVPLLVVVVGLSPVPTDAVLVSPPKPEFVIPAPAVEPEG